MIVCHCRVVTAATIRASIEDGAEDVRAVGEACGAGIGCGGCHPAIERLLDDAALGIAAPDALRERQAVGRCVPVVDVVAEVA
ncbi:MAG: bacterioferritin-associated ferredoxin [Nitriliruptoraceae bacterium]